MSFMTQPPGTWNHAAFLVPGTLSLIRECGNNLVPVLSKHFASNIPCSSTPWTREFGD
uniref:Uncharacterized protein n=1 Tax=Arundo donax TaxID=35708 RepID=A0A0A9C723_ARUDO